MNKNIVEANKKLLTNLETGLSSEEAKSRLNKHGYNQLDEKKKKNIFVRYLSQFKDPMLIILLIVAIISYVLAAIPKSSMTIFSADVEHVIEWIEPSIIILIVLVNSLFGTIQELKAEKAMESLKTISQPIVNVFRDGQVTQITSREIVPGDILLLEAGNTISADGIIIESSSFRVIESALTGESFAIDKVDDFVFDDKTPIGDRVNCVFSGTSVINGRATVLVTKTGMNTEIGKIAQYLNNEKKSKSPLEKKLTLVGKVLSIFAIVCSLIVFAIYVCYVNMPDKIAETWLDGFKIAISIGIAIIPEGLVAILTIVLAIGIKRMVAYNALIKKTSSVESLGSVSVICSDKTGTLTQNKMTVVKMFESNKFIDSNFKDNKKLIEYGMLCNDTKISDDQLIGDPTETSIVKLGQDTSIDFEKLNKKYQRVEELPFDSTRKLMTTIHFVSKNEYLVITKGAFDSLLSICDNKDVAKFEKANEEMSNQALRVLGVAIKKINKLPKKISFESIEKDLNLVGLFGIMDLARPEAKQAIKKCISAGIRPIMITGDHANTASAIAKELGILSGKQKTITGVELSQMSDEELKSKISDYSVYARVNPEDKIRVVKSWQANNEIVAMTGDGVNDAPALKAANVGCAMGITGTEVSKEAADIILLDDNFNTIVHSIQQGRGILNNIKRIMITLLTTNFSNLLSIMLCMLIFSFSPFTAIQILWINLVTESFLGIALGMKKPNDDVMKFSPKESSHIFDKKMIFKIAIQSILYASVILTAFFIGAGSAVDFNYNNLISVLKEYSNNYDAHIQSEKKLLNLVQMRGSTLAFVVLSISQSFNGFNMISHKNICTYKWDDVKYLIIAFSISFSSILFVILVPKVNEVFNSDIYSFFGDQSLSGDVTIDKAPVPPLPNEIYKVSIDGSNKYWYLSLIALFMAFIPTIIIEIFKSIYNAKWFSKTKFKNNFLKYII